MARQWGYWTRGKLDILHDYLTAFTTASSRAPERIYIDLFAGMADNRDRLTNERISGSPRIALSIDSPYFTRLVFFELDQQAATLERSLRSEFPHREFAVIPGDCNSTIHKALADIRHANRAPTFAFIDPNGPDIHWTSLMAIARFKRRGSTKAEIWLLFPESMFIRMLPKTGHVREKDAARITAMYGSQEWRAIYDARVARELTPSDARDEYLNLMRWRLENRLGYRQSHFLEIRNEQGNIMYHMIFATDSEVGTKIMSYLYAKAAAEFPAMREEARRLRRDIEEQEQGVLQLFDDTTLQAPPQPGEHFYEHERPWTPRFINDS